MAPNDPPDSAEKIRVQASPGDIIMLDTNGLLNNLFPSKIEQVLDETPMGLLVRPKALSVQNSSPSFGEVPGQGGYYSFFKSG